MVRRTTAAVGLVALLALAGGLSPVAAAPVKLARHPDYNAGKITFSYLGDIWTANEDGTNVHRVTDNRAREVYPRFSPDGKWIAFSSNRYGNYDVFVVATAGGAPKRLTYHTGNDEVVGWTRDSTNIIFRASRGDGVFPSVAVLYRIPVGGGTETPLPVDWGYWCSFSPDGRSMVFNRHPSVWSRQHYRGSYSADLWIGNSSDNTFRKLLPDDRYNRLWPMWGADNNIYYVADPLPNDASVAPGSGEVRKSLNNIYRIPASGTGQPVQVTKHADGNVFWPSMSADGKTIVYEDNFGIWKLDVATGKTNEIKLDIATDDKDNEVEMETVSNEVDSFDISPSGRRAVISTRGQILTIATDRGDITRILPDAMASRSSEPKWSPDGKLVAFVSDRSGRDEVWVSDPEGKAPKKITDLDNEKGALVWAPDSRALLYTAADKKLYSYAVADGKTSVLSSSTLGRIGSVSVSPDSKWVAFSKQDPTLRTHVYIIPIGGGEERHLADDSQSYSETNAVWTADGKYIVFTSAEGFSNGIASQGGINTTMELWVTALQDRDKDPMNRDIDNEAQGLAAEAAARQTGRGAGAGAASAQPADVKIDWSGLTHRARRLAIPGTSVGGLTPAPDGHSVALVIGNGGAGGRGAAPTTDAQSGTYIIHVETGQLTRVPQPAQTGAAGGGGGRGRGGAGAGGFGGGAMVFARDGRTLFYRQGSSLYAAPIGSQGGGAAAAQAAAAGGGRGGGRGGRGSGGGAAPQETPDANGTQQTARQVTFTANLDVDHKALRAQVFNEGWRIMKNRFYDAKMHGADWAGAEKTYGALLDYLVDEEELHTVMMMMIGQLNASHTGVSGGPNPVERTQQTRYPGFDLVADASGYKVGHIYKDGPADRDYLKIKEGNYLVAVDNHELKAGDNYWQYFTLAPGTKFHFLVNDKPSRDGAWEVTITPVANAEFGNLQYAKWVQDRKDMVARLSNGDIGYLHIRAMDAPSLRQFQLDLAANRTKKALIIDQRFNGGGGIDQELLGILAGRKYQYTVNRDAGFEQPRPQNFYGPMVVMQNERSASDAEMFPAGFKALGLGKVVGVPTMGAVIGTGSYTLLDGSTIRTPGSGVWLATGQNMENYGVPPDVLVDNTPNDFVKGRDAQIEKSVEVLKAELAKRAMEQPQQQRR
jgi:tricorn protease